MMSWNFTFDTAQFLRSVEARVQSNQDKIDAAARGIIESADGDMDNATAQFSNPLDKQITRQGPGSYQLETKDRRWKWLNKGTKPHVILPSRPGGTLIFAWAARKKPGLHIAKTSPNRLSPGSGTGNSYRGGVARHETPAVMHPGAKPRNWTGILYRKYLKEARRRIKAALRGR